MDANYYSLKVSPDLHDMGKPQLDFNNLIPISAYGETTRIKDVQWCKTVKYDDTSDKVSSSR